MKKVAIINRSFWPESHVIGKMLLQLSNELSSDFKVNVITQSKINLKEKLKDKEVNNLEYNQCRLLSVSSSNLCLRIFDAVYFFFWVLVCLIKHRPDVVYVSTNPPVIVPFLVSIYCTLFGRKFVYHVQDIHPEIVDVVMPLNRFVYSILKRIDNYTLNKANAIITLNHAMLGYLEKRCNKKLNGFILNNPGFDVTKEGVKSQDVVYCGNLGRLQKIDLLIESIKSYYDSGGKMKITFIGGGVFYDSVKKLELKYPKLSCLGILEPEKAEEIVSTHKWAILSIDERVDTLAFPSKSSSYVLSDCNLIGLCSHDTNVSEWIDSNKLGIVTGLRVDEVVDCLFDIQNGKVKYHSIEKEFSSAFTLRNHVDELKSIISMV